MNTRLVKEVIAGGVLVGLEALLLYGHGGLFNRYPITTASPKQANNVRYVPVTKLASVQNSQNWAGYEVTSGTYTSVSASWRVPQVTSPRGVAAQWIGLGGVNSHELVQTGTIEQQSGNGPTADVFVEKLPNHAQNIMSVPLGAQISASITPAGNNQWTLSISANYNGQTRTKSVTMNVSPNYALGMGTSAEWIFEDPANTQGSLYHLAKTQPVTFSHVEANGQAVGTASALIMTGGVGRPRVEPTMMKKGAFTVQDVRGWFRRPFPVSNWGPGSGVIREQQGGGFSISGPGFSITTPGYGDGAGTLGGWGGWTSFVHSVVIRIPRGPWTGVSL